MSGYQASGGGGRTREDVVMKGDTDPVYTNPMYTSTPRQVDPPDYFQGDTITSPLKLRQELKLHSNQLHLYRI